MTFFLPPVYHTQLCLTVYSTPGTITSFQLQEPPSSSLPQDLCISCSLSLKKFSPLGFWQRHFFILYVVMGAPQMSSFLSYVTPSLNGASSESFAHQNLLPSVSLISILWFPSLEGHITDLNYLIIYLYFGFGFCLPPSLNLSPKRTGSLPVSFSALSYSSARCLIHSSLLI